MQKDLLKSKLIDKTNDAKSSPTINVKIPQTEKQFIKGATIVGYCIFVFDNEREWTVFRRYSHFIQLHDCLSSTFKIPALPPKSWWASNDSFLESRRLALEIWLIQLVHDKEIILQDEMISFLGAERYRSVSNDGVNATLVDFNWINRSGAGKGFLATTPNLKKSASEKKKENSLCCGLFCCC